MKNRRSNPNNHYSWSILPVLPGGQRDDEDGGDDGRGSPAGVGLACLGGIAGYVFLSVLLCHGVFRELAGRPGAASLLRAAAYGVGAVLAGVALVAGSYVAQPENPLWEFILRHPGNPLALSAGARFACLPLAVALAAVLVHRVQRAEAP